jgi:hypothetical protein
MTPDDIKALADALKIASEKGFWEQASFIGVVVSAITSAIALLFIFFQMKGGNDQLRVLNQQVGAMQAANATSVEQLQALTDQLAAMQAANVTGTEELKILRQQLESMQKTNVQTYEQMQVAEDRAAKELAINLMLTWEQRLQFQTQQVARLVEKLDREQCVRLENGQEFYIREDLKDIAELCMPSDLLPLQQDAKGILISGKALIHLRFTTVSYLNLIESILTAWHQNVIDRAVIEDQFAFLRHDGEDVLETFREASGKDYYPSISRFLERLKQLEEERLPRAKDKTPLQAALAPLGPKG